jgi:hypothetical protein
MHLKIEKSQFDVPPGTYNAEFLGYDDLPPAKDGKARVDDKGKPLGPAIVWSYLILDGPERGKRAERITTKMATAENACTAMASAVAGRPLDVDDSIDVGAFVGNVYKLRVAQKKRGQGYHVSEIGMFKIGDAEAAALKAKFYGGANGDGNESAAAPEEAARKVFVKDNGEALPEPKSVSEIEDLLKAGAKLGTLLVADGGRWRPAAEVFPSLADVAPF